MNTPSHLVINMLLLDGVAGKQSESSVAMDLLFTYKSRFRILPDRTDQGAVRRQWLFHCQAPQRGHGLSGSIPFGRAVRQPSAAFRSLAMEQPLRRERVLHMTDGRLAEVRFVGKGQA